MSIYYASYPKASFTYPTTDLSYVVFKYYGNSTATSGNIISGNITSGTYTSPDLSFNTLYTFTMTPYRNEVAGQVRSISIDTTSKVSGGGGKANY